MEIKGANFFEGIPPEAVEGLLLGMPKAELHMHVEGSLEPESIVAIAARNKVALPYADADALRAAYDFEDLQSFLDLYGIGAGVLRTRSDFFEMADAYLARAARDNVARAEMFFDTTSHAANGISPDDVILGLHRACEQAPARHGASAGLILCFLRHLGEREAFEALDHAAPHLDKIVGVGLAGGERGNPPAKFARVFAKAKAMGLRLVAHAGEEGGPGYVRSALDDLGVHRIDHGVRALEDPALVGRLVREGVPLTVCPLSNVRLKVFASMRAHPLKRMLEAGLAASVHSDDPSYFGGHVNENLAGAHRALGLSAAQAYALGRNGIEASFMEAAPKAALVARLDELFEAAWAPGGSRPRAPGPR